MTEWAGAGATGSPSDRFHSSQPLVGGVPSSSVTLDVDKQFSLACPLNHGGGSRGKTALRSWAVTCAAAEQGPHHSRVVVGQCDRSHVGPAPGAKPRRPGGARMSAAAAMAIQQRARAMDEQRAQVAIAVLADAEQHGLAARGMLARREPEIRAQFAAAFELARI